jgi:hypothetical protein
MKTWLICTSALVMLGAALGLAQEERLDVVYLLDGSVIRGTIIEQIPNKRLKIETRDGTIRTIDFSRIKKITKEDVAETSRQRPTRASDTRLIGGALFGGLSYAGLYPAAGVRLGTAIAGMAYVGIGVTTAFGDITASYFGADLGFNLNADKVTTQVYLSIGLGSVVGASRLALGPGVTFLYWVNDNLGVGLDGKYMFVPDFAINFGLIEVAIVYRF